MTEQNCDKSARIVRERSALEECPVCDGSGECPDCGDGWFDEEEECVSCNDSCNCYRCGGSGKVES